MIVRRDVASQAIGFFSLENAISLAALVVAAGLPLILETAFLFDLLLAVVVFGDAHPRAPRAGRVAVHRRPDQAARKGAAMLGVILAILIVPLAAARRVLLPSPRPGGAGLTIGRGIASLRARARAGPGRPRTER